MKKLILPFLILLINISQAQILNKIIKNDLIVSEVSDVISHAPFSYLSTELAIDKKENIYLANSFQRKIICLDSTGLIYKEITIPSQFYNSYSYL